MKRALLPVVLLLALAGCPTPEVPAGLSLDQPDWAESEISQYSVVVDEDTVGQHIVQLHRVEFESVPALNLVIETLSGDEGTVSHDSAWVMLRLADLRPIRSSRSISNPEFTASIEVSYSRDSARVSALTPAGPESGAIPLEPLDYDNDQVTQLVRALPLEPDTALTFGVVIGIIGDKTPAELRLVGTETVTVPAGTFDCRRVQLTIAGQQVDIWYETEGLRRMVRYAAPVADLVMELTASVVN
ncbi:MAG: DUF3108 domain-containing protein [bacterium]